MKFIKNKKNEDFIKIRHRSFKMYECMKHIKLGTLVDFDENKSIYQGNVTAITLRGVDIVTSLKVVFVKWENIIGVYID